MSFRTELLLLCFLCSFSNVLLANVTVRKCCDLDKYMSKSTNYKCIKITTKLDNYLKFYRPDKGSLENEIPENWNLISEWPSCTNTKRYNFEPVVIFSNGSLFSRDHNTLIHPSQYCYDYKLAQICENEKHVPKVKKCCGSKAVYTNTKKTCVALNATDYKIDLPKHLELTEGFPVCDREKIIAGKFNETKLQSNGSLLFIESNILLEEGSFCLEHVFEKAGT